MHVGGRMEVESAPGKGSRITLWLSDGSRGSNLEMASEEQPISRADTLVTVLRGKRKACRVLIVDDHEIMRDGLKGLLQFEAGMEVVGEAADGAKAIELAKHLKPDVIVMDVNLGDMTGIEATRRITAEMPSVRIIGLSMHMDAQIAVAMKEAGAVAYLTKGGPAEDLVSAIRACVSRR